MGGESLRIRTICYLGLPVLVILALALTVLGQGEVQNSAYRAFYAEQNAQKKAELGEKFLADFKESTYRAPILKTILTAYVQSQNWAKVLEHAEKLPTELSDADNPTKALVYTYGMAAAQATNNAAKTVDYGDKVLAVDPNNLQAQVFVSTTIPQGMPQDKAANDRALDLSTKALAGVQQYFGQPKPAEMTEVQWKQARVEYEDQLHSARGLIYFNRSDYGKSAEEYLEVIKNSPKDGVAHFYLGYTYRNETADLSKELVEAIKAFDAARLARKSQPEIDELDARRQGLQDEFTKKRDSALDALATSLAVADPRVPKQAREALESLYKAKNNESLEGLDQFINSKKPK
jgi:tetratricopeptide (TPR) repeat protein